MASMLPLTAILNPSREPEDRLNVRLPSANAVNFYPFENLNEVSTREIRKYQIHTFGQIQDSCRRIPYNTGKRDFYEKTGRTCFEVFQYDFKVPGCDTAWTVMWDYKIGLVRTTPFFKCCDYSKTISAKMLNQNPGLRDISHSITGGAIRAQGYWMPFECARAVCATFCYRIAGALIPLFGPTFPSECIPPNTPQHGRMIINPAIIGQSKREAEDFRRLYGSMPSPPTPSLSNNSPRSSGGLLRTSGGHGFQDHHRSWPFTRTDSDIEVSSLSRLQRLPPLQTQIPTPILSSAESTSYSLSTAHSSPRAWRAVNVPPYPSHPNSCPNQGPALSRDEPRPRVPNSRYHSLEEDPYRSAVPSSYPRQRDYYHHPLPLPNSGETLRVQPRGHPDTSASSWIPRHPRNVPSPGEKRRYDDYEYDAGESANGSSPEAPSPKVLHEKKFQIALHPQLRASDSRRCSVIPKSLSVDTNHGSDTSKSHHVNSLSESELMSHSSSETRDPAPLSPRRSASAIPADAYRREVLGARDTRPVNMTRYKYAPSPTTTGAGREKKIGGEQASYNSNKRSPSFSGAERVAVQALMHLGVFAPQQQQEPGDSDHDSDKAMAIDICPQESTDPSPEMSDDVPISPRHVVYPLASPIIYCRMDTDADNSESTAHPRSDIRDPASSTATSIPRRGSRIRLCSKRRKGRSF